MPINKEKIYTSFPRPELNFIFPLFKKKNKTTSRLSGEFKYKGHGRCCRHSAVPSETLFQTAE